MKYLLIAIILYIIMILNVHAEMPGKQLTKQKPLITNYLK